MSNPSRRSAPHRPHPERQRRLDQLAGLHAGFVRANADTAGFNPEGRRTGGDYNVHHVDIDADPAALDAFHRRAAAIFTTD